MLDQSDFGPKMPDVRVRTVYATITCALMAVSGCGPTASTAAPPMVICGIDLHNSPAGTVLDDATRKLPVITYTDLEGQLYLRVARGCDHGSTVTWDPTAAARLVKVANAKDGRPVAVVLKVSGPRAAFQLTAKQNNQVVASATVKLNP